MYITQKFLLIGILSKTQIKLDEKSQHIVLEWMNCQNPNASLLWVHCPVGRFCPQHCLAATFFKIKILNYSNPLLSLSFTLQLLLSSFKMAVFSII